MILIRFILSMSPLLFIFGFAQYKQTTEKIAESYKKSYFNHDLTFTQNDTVLLAKLIAAECSICDVYEQMDVADAVLERIVDSRFPNTIETVVKDKNQFANTDHINIWEFPDCYHTAAFKMKTFKPNQKPLYFVLKTCERDFANCNVKFLNWVKSKPTINHDYHVFR